MSFGRVYRLPMQMKSDYFKRVLIAGGLFVIMSGFGVSRTAGDSAGALRVTSPDGSVEVVFSLRRGAPHYRIDYKGRPLILPSALGFTFRNKAPLLDGFVIGSAETGSYDETWHPVWGQRSEICNKYNELRIVLSQEKSGGREMAVVFRVYDDGLGFRYEIPRQRGIEDFEIMSEKTQFAFAGDHSVWYIPADLDSYEYLYRHAPLSKVKAVATPVTMETEDGLCISVHEAALTDYPEMTLSAVWGRDLVLESNLAPWPDGVRVKGKTPLNTPWRTVQIAESAGALIESSLILNLNEPCVIEDTSFIKPMKYIGIWWGMHIGKYSFHIGPNHGATTENAKRYIDFASDHGIKGLLIEGWNTGWDRWGQKDAYSYTESYRDFDLEEVTRYAREKGVAIIGHHETGGDVPSYEEQLDAAFDLYKRVGITAIKTGYAGRIFPRGHYHHGQHMVRHYRMVVEKAAEYGFMLDVHEPIKPTGISRTYPNMMTREGVRGTEYNAWSEGNPPDHETILAFTRMLAGPLDYTPVIFDCLFDEYRPENRVRTTLAKQLALFIVLYSPIQMAADLIENYEGHPAFKFIEDAPVDWDDTMVLNGKIGDYVTIVRRSGGSYYVGSITDEKARELDIELSFLETGVEYAAKIYADAPDADWETNPHAYEIQEVLVDSDTVLKMKLAPGGGQAISIVPAGAGE
jgi:alpha-glucosidase